MSNFLLSKSGEVLLKATHKYISKKKGKNGKWEYDYGQTGKGKSKRSKEQVSNAQAKDIIAFNEKGLSIEEISDLTGVSTIMVRDTLRVGKEMAERKKNEKRFRGADDNNKKIHQVVDDYVKKLGYDSEGVYEKDSSLYEKLDMVKELNLKEYRNLLTKISEKIPRSVFMNIVEKLLGKKKRPSFGYERPITALTDRELIDKAFTLMDEAFGTEGDKIYKEKEKQLLISKNG